MSKVAHTPQLRFPEFSGDWEEKKLSDISDVRDGTHESPKYVLDGFPLITSKNLLSNGSIDFENINLVSEEDYTNINKRSKVDINDILFGMIGTIGNPVIVKETGFAIKNVALIKQQKELLNKFMIFYLSGNSIAKQFYIENTGGTQKFLALGVIRSLKIKFPPDTEQQKIAAFLTAVDNKIEQLIKKQELLGEYKKGLMQQIFSQAIRFKADDGSDFPDWEEKKLGDILDYEQPTNYIVDSTEYDNSFDMPVLTAGKSFILGYTNETHKVFENIPVIIFDDFTTANKYVDFPFKVKSSAMKILKPKDSFVNIRLIFEFIQMLNFPIGEHKRYWISEYQDLKIPFPSFEEQTKIASFLSSIDNKIEQVGKQLDESKQFKKALLQQMFV